MEQELKVTPAIEKPKTKKNKLKKPKKRTRSPEKTAAKFPRHSLAKSLRIASAILEQNAGKACTPKEAAAFVGVGLNGPFNVEISSGLKFGFLSRPETGKIEPTQLAKRALRPQSEGDDIEAFREAIRKAPDIAEAYNHYRGENLPDEQFLQNTALDTFKVPAESFAEFKSVLLESLETAKLLQKHGEKLRVIDISGDPTKGSVPSDRLVKLGREVSLATGQSCFVMQPFAPPLGDYYEKIYKPAIEKAGLRPIRADADIFGTGNIMDQVWSGISAASVLVAELTTRNPNVFYELGLAHASKKPVVLVSSREEDVPFDLQHIRVIYYDQTDPFWGTKLMDKVAENILSALRNPEEAVFKIPQ
jgi:hypothetical protein